jgi:hypothetical protein
MQFILAEQESCWRLQIDNGGSYTVVRTFLKTLEASEMLQLLQVAVRKEAAAAHAKSFSVRHRQSSHEGDFPSLVTEWLEAPQDS